jgi:hypothetical protein
VPTKAAYLQLATNPDLEFEHFLAVKLGKSVRELRCSMSHAEFVRWTIYYARIAQQQELEQLKTKG